MAPAVEALETAAQVFYGLGQIEPVSLKETVSAASVSNNFVSENSAVN